MTHSFDKQTILIVDDVQTNITVLAELLKEDYAIKVATNGKAALRISDAVHQPDLIFLDVMMPEMDGYEVLKNLKRSPQTRDIPVIFITAMDEVKDEAYGLNLGAVDYITKPFNPILVKARVKNHLERKRNQDALKELSTIDGLTKIPNRRYFDEYLASEWNRSLRNHRPLSLIMLDIDYFKNYNDTYGHLQGDDCLRKVAKILQGEIKRSSDRVARWGGEEFVCLLPETDNTIAFKIAENLREKITMQKISHESSQVANIITISIGVVTLIPNENQTSEVLLKLADQALYKAKETGRNQVCSHHDLNTLTMKNSQIETLRIAIIDDDQMIREMIYGFFEDFSFPPFHIEIKTFNHGQSFFDSDWHCQSGPYFIILDGMMPQMDGIEVLQKLKQDYDAKQYIVLMLTGRKSEQDIIQALEIGADDYMVKPFSIRELEARMTSLFKKLLI